MPQFVQHDAAENHQDKEDPKQGPGGVMAHAPTGNDNEPHQKQESGVHADVDSHQSTALPCSAHDPSLPFPHPSRSSYLSPEPIPTGRGRRSQGAGNRPPCTLRCARRFGSLPEGLARHPSPALFRVSSLGRARGRRGRFSGRGEEMADNSLGLGLNPAQVVLTEKAFRVDFVDVLGP